MAQYDAALRHLTVPYETLIVPTRHGETHLLAAGAKDAPPVVLIHAWTANATMWILLLNGLAGGFRLYAPDVFGHTGKSAPTQLPPSGPAYAEWLKDVLEGLHLQQAAFVGISGGGWIVLRFAAYAPEFLTQAVLISPAGMVPSPASALARMALYVSLPTAANVRKFVQMMFGPAQPAPDGVVEVFQLSFRQFKNRLGGPGVLSDADLRRLSAPTLVLIGQHDPLFPAEGVIARARAIWPECVGDIISAMGHIPSDADWATIRARVLRFLTAETLAPVSPK